MPVPEGALKKELDELLGVRLSQEDMRIATDDVAGISFKQGCFGWEFNANAVEAALGREGGKRRELAKLRGFVTR